MKTGFKADERRATTLGSPRAPNAPASSHAQRTRSAVGRSVRRRRTTKRIRLITLDRRSRPGRPTRPRASKLHLPGVPSTAVHRVRHCCTRATRPECHLTSNIPEHLGQTNQGLVPPTPKTITSFSSFHQKLRGGRGGVGPLPAGLGSLGFYKSQEV